MRVTGLLVSILALAAGIFYQGTASAETYQKMRKSFDKMEGTTWYKDATSPDGYNEPSENSFYIYIGQKAQGDPWLRLRVQYSGSGWLFVHSFFLVVDGQRFDKPLVNFEREVRYEGVYERYDEDLMPEDQSMIRAIINSKEATLRFEGEHHVYDMTISKTQKQALQNVLDAYTELKWGHALAKDKAPPGAKPEHQTKQAPPSNLTNAERDALMRQIAQCWNVAGGASSAKDIAVALHLVVGSDRMLQQATVVNQERYNSDPAFRASADTALRTLRNPSCSPLDLPPGKYDGKPITITLDPKDML